MTKKALYALLAMIILCLCCSVSFATDNNSVTLGNEIMQSIDKTGESINNLVSDNMVNDMDKTVEEGVNNVEGTMSGMTNYTTTQTTAERTTGESGVNMMSTTTWMWIILVVAAVIIIAAIWYYATQNS